MDIKEQQHLENATNYARHPWELARFEVAFSLIKEALQDKPQANILDVGCGDTFFIERLATRYPNAHYYGLDTAFTAKTIQVYQEQLGTKPIQLGQRFCDFNIKKTIDVVLLLDVIEHIEHERDFLKKLSSHPKITPETSFIITVPAYQSLFCAHDVFLDHYRRYDNESLQEAVEAAGLDVVDISYFFTTLVPIRWLQVWREKRSTQAPSTTGLVEWKGGAFKTQLLKNILIADAFFSKGLKRLTGIRLPGLSNYVVCRKSV